MAESRGKKEETVEKIGERKGEKVEKSSVKKEDMGNSSAKTILKKEEKGTAENAKEGFVKTLRKVNFNEKEEVYNVHIEEDDSSNDTDLVIDENINVGEFPLSENNSTEDSDDDSYLHIPLSQIKMRKEWFDIVKVYNMTQNLMNLVWVLKKIIQKKKQKLLQK